MPSPMAGGGPTFKKPVNMTPPLTAFDPQYLQRKLEVPEQIFKLESGKQLAFFTEGNVEDPAVVCCPAAGMGKCCFIPREPIPGVFLIAIDDMGHGNSSPLEGLPVFSESVPEIQELVDHLGINQFFVLGWSRGGVHAMQIATALHERVLGCAVVSSPGNLHHPSLSKKERKKIDAQGALIMTAPGCIGGLVRRMMKGIYYYPDKTKDFGFAGHSSGGFSYYKSKATGGAPKEMSSDHFYVTKLLDSELHGMNTVTGLSLEMQGLFHPWSYDIANIKCPCFLYVESKGEVPITHVQLNNRLIPGSELIVFQEHGHCSIMMEFEKIVLGLVKGNSVQSSYTTN